jgi:hypothetical protein
MAFKNLMFEFFAKKVRRSGEFSKSLTKNIALSSTNVSNDVQPIERVLEFQFRPCRAHKDCPPGAPANKHDPRNAKFQQLADG